ncbi:hypothetical protein OG705_21300 [Streptomyces sp. NBC_00838]|uniref:hypothetical protein n=1 Tax=Streptomyces sp. NBC_00838 TaxID=2903680 RepID=UPI00386B5358|nr:hypothetical protein OG705_21300 [Streptomyces sp. NBC_00838]
MEVRDGDSVSTEVEGASSRILEMMALKGKVTESGAKVSRCSDYEPEDEVYRARQPWSVYDLPVPELEKAMDRLRQELPKAGWTIVKDGTDGTPAKAPQIIAESKGREFAADIRLMDQRKYGDDPSLILVAVESACFRAK